MPDNQTVSHSQSIFHQKNDFNFLALVQSRIESFSLKPYKISEQQVNPKVLSVANSCHYNENSKMANIVYRQMPTPWELPQQIPAPQAKAWMQKPQGGGKFLVRFPRGEHGGRWLWMKLIPAL